MRRFATLFAMLLPLCFCGCDDSDGFTTRDQIRRVNSLINNYPATKSEFREFINDIETGVWDIDNWITYRNGEIWSTTFNNFVNIAFGKGSQFLNLVFYADGTCRQCYLYAPAPYDNIPYPLLYTTLLWSFDTENLTIKLTNTDYQALNSPYAETTLNLRYYRYGEFIMDGLEPSTEPMNGYMIRYIGTIGSPALRLEYQSEYQDESIYAALNNQ